MVDFGIFSVNCSIPTQFRPFHHVRLVPFGKGLVGAGVAIEPVYSICPVQQYHHRRSPLVVEVQRVAMKKMRILEIHNRTPLETKKTPHQ